MGGVQEKLARGRRCGSSRRWKGDARRVQGATQNGTEVGSSGAYPIGKPKLKMWLAICQLGLCVRAGSYGRRQNLTSSLARA
eukprot:4237547-Pleurochrysis_carterae.AAC.1